MQKHTANVVVPYLNQELVDELKAQLTKARRPFWARWWRQGRA